MGGADATNIGDASVFVTQHQAEVGHSLKGVDADAASFSSSTQILRHRFYQPPA